MPTKTESESTALIGHARICSDMEKTMLDLFYPSFELFVADCVRCNESADHLLARGVYVLLDNGGGVIAAEYL